MIHTNGNTTIKKSTNSRLFSSAFVFLVLASISDSVFARYGSCGYPRRYNSHWGNWDNWGHCGRRSCRRRYNPMINIFDDLVDAGLNTLARQERRNVAEARSRRNLAVEEARNEIPPRYYLEDHGTSGLELTVELLGLQAHEIDLEISRNKDGVHTFAVRGSPGVHRRRSAKTSEFSQSFLVNDDTIDVDGINASISSGILKISMPRKARKRTRVVPSITKSLNGKNKGGDEILVFDAKRQKFYGSDKRSAKKTIDVDENSRKSFNKSESKKKRKKQYQDDDDGDDDLWISEAEDIW